MNVVAHSGKKFWWKCPRGPDHEWSATVNDRTSTHKTGCPFCAGKRVSITNSLESLHLAIAAEWHPTKNGGLTPEDIVAHTNKRYWWKCPRGWDHEWESSPNTRTTKKGICPFCDGKRASVTNSLASLAPETAAEWHPTKNRSAKPENVTARSGVLRWWKCPRGADHEWRATPDNRTKSGGTRCPFCMNQRVSASNSLAAVRPDLVAEWHPKRNGKTTPNDVVAYSAKSYWWKCPKGPDHEWSLVLSGPLGQIIK